MNHLELNASATALLAAPLTPPLLSISEQQAILAHPDSLAVLMDYHDRQESMANATGEPGDGGKSMERRLEIKAIGLKLVSEDPELWSKPVLREFGYLMA